MILQDSSDKINEIENEYGTGLRNLEGLPASTVDTQRKLKNNE